ncbi:SurA N-terminal domain-containing protein [Polycladidibacter hongkongensis]|uniref:SurA N-terminal domain-containing protein n=1 Tax=Polycladidibacter hongkongensis TaxID=1647556 RepID=UPI00082A18C4|nr:SurA N-terminal domain-containing protein [Pseudovibrio hongkongensis]
MFHQLRGVALACAIAVGLGVCIGNMPNAQAATRIVVVVNDKPITSYDLQQRSRLIALTTRASSSVAKRRAKEELVDEALKTQEANRVGITVSDKQVDQAYASIAGRLKLSPSQFSQALRQNGVNPSTLKKRLRVQISWQEAIMRRFRATVRIEEADVIAALKDKGEKTGEVLEYDLQRIVFVVPKSASAKKKKSRQTEMRKLRERFTSCSEGLRLANGLKEVIVKPIGKRLANEISPGNREKLEKMSVGRLTAPQKTDVGFEMVALCGKEKVSSDAVAREAAEGELRNKEGQMMSRRYLRDLRRNAVIEER